MLTLHTQESAPQAAKATLATIDHANGFTPNLFRTLANAPSSLNGFVAMLGANDDGTLSPVERQIVQLAASAENQSQYCVAGHTVFATKIGMANEVIVAVRDNKPLADQKYQQLADFTRALVKQRGHVTTDEVAAFVASGYRADQVLEVITCIALKTITNFVSTSLNLPLDPQFADGEWTAPGTGKQT
jgi:uncharacterized peroxidase-related enzyme